MTTVAYKSTSPYADTPQTSWYLGFLSFRAIQADSDDNIITVDKKYENRPDLLSQTLYGTTDYWWVFMVRNPDLFQDPIYDLVAGMQIFVPKKTNIDKS